MICWIAQLQERVIGILFPVSLLDGGRRRWRAGWEAVVNVMVLVRCSRHYPSIGLIELIVAIKCRT